MNEIMNEGMNDWLIDWLIEWLNEWMFFITDVTVWSKAATHASTKKTKKLKQNAERYGVRELSPVEVQWAVRWAGEDLWWKDLWTGEF